MMLRLPYPPSVNRYWRHISKGKLAGRVLISEEGRNYRKAAVLAVGTIGEALQDRLHATITLYPPDRRRRDIDNTPKAILDALSHAGVYGDDSQIDRLLIIRQAPEPGGYVTVEITSA